MVICDSSHRPLTHYITPWPALSIGEVTHHGTAGVLLPAGNEASLGVNYKNVFEEEAQKGTGNLDLGTGI